jgi:hypothetical protein
MTAFTLLRAAEETETKQGNIQDWLQLDEGDPGFQLLTEKEVTAEPPTSLNFPVTCFISFFCLLGLSFASLIVIIGYSGRPRH